MPTEVKVDFYTVEMPAGSDPLEDVIKADADSTDDETRNLEIGGYPVRLQEAHTGREIVDGEMLKIQMSDLPPKAKLSGRIGNLGLADDEGIGGETAFLYHPQTKSLAIQRNRNGVTARIFAQYFHDKAGLNPEIVLRPVIQPDAITRLANLKETKKIKVRFAGITNPNFFKDMGGSVSQMVDVLDYFKAPNGLFEISMGRQPGSLLAQRVVTLGRRLLNLSAPGSGGDVTTMEVSGIMDDDSRDQFDVLMYRMVEVVNVDEDRNRRTTYRRRRAEIRQAFDRRKNDLLAMFGPGHESGS